METATCTSCHKQIGGRDINYTPDARIVCQACLDGGRPAVGADGMLVREYEFDANENDVIRTLAGPLRFVGVISVVFGVLNAGLGLLVINSVHGLLTVGEGVALIAIGAWLAAAATSFREVVTSEGSDITNLMHALRKLRSAFTLQAWLLGIACALLVVMFLLVVAH